MSTCASVFQQMKIMQRTIRMRARQKKGMLVTAEIYCVHLMTT
jgi:hypothetical protein